MRKWKIRRDDQVVIISGKAKGEVGKVLKVFREKNLVLVEGINLSSKHTKPSSESAGGIIKKETPIHVSNISIFDSKTSKGTRIGFKLTEKKLKVRYYKKSGEILG